MDQFNKIAPFRNEEFGRKIKELVADEQFVKIVGHLYPDTAMRKNVLQRMYEIDNVEDFQSEIIVPLLDGIKKSSTAGLSYSTMEMFKPEQNYLFVSNHRDIILDPAFLNLIMHKNGFKKTEIAIGDNLLIYKWIELLVRINRAFVVKRGLGLREQLGASQNLSDYIRHTLTHNGESVWIAQREGRTKDGNDQTQVALMKMLNMSSKKPVIEAFRELNIVPMAISYEIEPCGLAKVEELLKRKYDENFAKTQQDDLKSMANGMMMPKGRVHFGFGNPLNIRIDEVADGKTGNDCIAAIAEFIDKRIYYNYKRWPNNYIAVDVLRNNSRYDNRYSSDEKEAFIEKMDAEIGTLAFDAEEARQMYLAMYANPVLNFEKYFG